MVHQKSLDIPTDLAFNARHLACHVQSVPQISADSRFHLSSTPIPECTRSKEAQHVSIWARHQFLNAPDRRRHSIAINACRQDSTRHRILLAVFLNGLMVEDASVVLEREFDAINGVLFPTSGGKIVYAGFSIVWSWRLIAKFLSDRQLRWLLKIIWTNMSGLILS